jgi:hypothetical protein
MPKAMEIRRLAKMEEGEEPVPISANSAYPTNSNKRMPQTR